MRAVQSAWPEIAVCIPEIKSIVDEVLIIRHAVETRQRVRYLQVNILKATNWICEPLPECDL